MYYGRSKVNFINDYQGSFRRKFGRDPKVWTIEELHTLWFKTLDRNRLRSIEKNSLIEKIVKAIPANDRGEHVVYYRHDKSSSISSYSVKWDNKYNSHTIGYSTVSFSDDKVFGRQEKIDFLMTPDESFELGNEYRFQCRLDCRLQYTVFAIMWGLISDSLSKQLKDNCEYDIYTVSIGKYKYYAKVDKDTKYGYGDLKFDFGGESTDDIIKF